MVPADEPLGRNNIIEFRQESLLQEALDNHDEDEIVCLLLPPCYPLHDRIFLHKPSVSDSLLVHNLKYM